MRTPGGPRSKTVVAIVLIALGGLTFVGAVSHFVENQYNVFITPADAGTWSVMLPRPIIAMRLEVTGQMVTHRPTETPYGTMQNVSGTGEVILRYSLSRFELRLTRFGIEDSGRFFIGLSGQANESSFLVWMASQAVAGVNVSGIGSWQGFHLGSGMNCGGPAYFGDVSPGWNIVSARALDCLIGIDAIPWLELIAPALFVAGGAVLYHTRRRGGVT